jgi:hypothetical protein
MIFDRNHGHYPPDPLFVQAYHQYTGKQEKYGTKMESMFLRKLLKIQNEKRKCRPLFELILITKKLWMYAVTF